MSGCRFCGKEDIGLGHACAEGIPVAPMGDPFREGRLVSAPRTVANHVGWIHYAPCEGVSAVLDVSRDTKHLATWPARKVYTLDPEPVHVVAIEEASDRISSDCQRGLDMIEKAVGK